MRRLPLKLQKFCHGTPQKINLADFILILADLISRAYFMQQRYNILGISNRDHGFFQGN